MQDSIGRIVQFFVATVALEIIVSFFYHCDHEYEDKWRHISEHETDLQEWYELTQRNDEEEHVEEEFELVVQHLEQEAKNVVLLVVQPVRAEMRGYGRTMHVQFAFL